MAIVFIVILMAILFQFAGNFRLDASSDSLVLENDKSLEYYSEVISKYDTSDILMLTYSPTDDLFSEAVLSDLSTLREQVLALDGIKSVLSIIDVPLTQSPPITLSQLNDAPTLLSEKVDRDLAKQELRNSQLYRKLLVNDDYSTTALVVSLTDDAQVSALYKQRNDLRKLRASSEAFTTAQKNELKQITIEHQQKSSAFQAKRDQMVHKLRDIMREHSTQAQLFLGGVPMIVTDSTRFIRGDVLVFGAGALAIIVFILIVAFRQTAWVVIPLITCFTTGYCMVCLLGLLNWPISVVSSNFLALLLIITLSLNIHLIVRYRELAEQNRDSNQLDLIRETISSKFIPCVFTSLTTIVAFASLIVSGIRPVIDFGFIMCLGILVSLVVTFTLFPALSMLMKPKKGIQQNDKISTAVLNAAQILQSKTAVMIAVFTVVTALIGLGLTQLSVENRFIDYFKPETEIYKGMVTIDEELGGTTPLNIIIDAPASYFIEKQQRAKQLQATLEEQKAKANNVVDEDDDFFDDFDDQATESAAEQDDDFFDDFDDQATDAEAAGQTKKSKASLTSSYWFNEQGLQKLKGIHASLEAFPETGKVLSVATSMSLFDNLKNAKPMDNIDLGFMYSVLSDDNKNTLFKPYLSEDGNQVHINIRVFETQKGLNRNELISNIKQTLVDQHAIEPEQIHVSGMLVLYNNMLNSLFESQIKALGTVFLAIFIMFIVLFKNIRLALITLAPNLFSAGIVLGIMGLFSIPLDLMTITIAAISVGIAVDNSIHYVHRFKQAYKANHSYLLSIDEATNNVGKAMFYTTLVITSGFMIMVFSNFVPTMYFGVLTGIAMITALVANLLMLPMLINWLKPAKSL